MIKKCTNELLVDFEQKLLDNKIVSLVIEEKEDGFYADYMLSVEPVKTLNLSLRLQAASAIKQFAAMLLVDKVNNFSLQYNIEEGVCLVNNSYKVSSVEITRDVKLEKMKNLITEAISIATDINVDVALTDIVERPKKSAKCGNTKLNDITVLQALNKISEVLK